MAHIEWWQLVDGVTELDRVEARAYNAGANLEFRLQLGPGPLPYFGDIERAPIVLLIANPPFMPDAMPIDHSFSRLGWPLSALHPEAPAPMHSWWHERLAILISTFGAQVVANVIAAIPLTPWASPRFDRDLRLPSRARMLSLAIDASRRDALIVTMREPALWTEAAELASLPRTRNLMPRSWRTSHVSPSNLGVDGWAQLCERVEAYLRADPGGPAKP